MNLLVNKHYCRTRALTHNDLMQEGSLGVCVCIYKCTSVQVYHDLMQEGSQGGGCVCVCVGVCVRVRFERLVLEGLLRVFLGRVQLYECTSGFSCVSVLSAYGGTHHTHNACHPYLTRLPTPRLAVHRTY